MKSDRELSDEQKAALELNVRLVEACPGAGKTRAIVQRYKVRADESERGVALLSFTNAAIDEATARCSDRPDLLRAPHFVGTFDTFLHRYIVTPNESAALTRAPTYLQSWNELPSPLRTLKAGEVWQRVSLSSFSHASDGEIRLLAGGLKGNEKQAYESLGAAAQQRLVQSGAAKIRSFNAGGLYDSDSARWKALAILRGDGQDILARLSNRFSDVTVDEFQDCAALEHELLAILRDAGIRVTVVADPDQAIFAFRQAEPQLYSGYRASIDAADIVTLATNYRSTPAICALVDALSSSEMSMIPMVKHEASALPPVYLLGGTVEKVRARYLELAEAWDVPLGERVALAHRANDARALAAGGKKPPDSESHTAELLQDLAILRSSGSALIRRRALGSIERLFVSEFDWSGEQEKGDSTQKLELLGKDRLWVRLIVGELLAAAASWGSASITGLAIRKVLSKHFAGLPIAIEGQLGRRFAKPNTALWAYWNDAGAGRDQTVEVSWSTIHASKGREYDAVLLKVPGAAVITSWLAGDVSEERRVFYVGASRARRLLVLAVSAKRQKEVKGQLEHFGLAVVAEMVR
jgi:DNA helicase-2/ATP-dependent DNA helicase PcrA